VVRLFNWLGLAQVVAAPALSGLLSGLPIGRVVYGRGLLMIGGRRLLMIARPRLVVHGRELLMIARPRLVVYGRELLMIARPRLVVHGRELLMIARPRLVVYGRGLLMIARPRLVVYGRGLLITSRPRLVVHGRGLLVHGPRGRCVLVSRRGLVRRVRIGSWRRILSPHWRVVRRTCRLEPSPLSNLIPPAAYTQQTSIRMACSLAPYLGCGREAAAAGASRLPLAAVRRVRRHTGPPLGPCGAGRYDTSDSRIIFNTLTFQHLHPGSRPHAWGCASTYRDIAEVRVIELVEIQAIQVDAGQVRVVAQVGQGVFLGRDTLPLRRRPP
jgi:hypothetical protein